MKHPKMKIQKNRQERRKFFEIKLFLKKKIVKLIAEN